MGAYFGFGQDTSTAATTIISLNQPASALKRLIISHLEIGADATADNAYEASLKRISTAGTATGFTPTLRDPADGAASGVFGFAHTVEPTYTAGADQLVVFAHQRANYQWYAAPGHEIIIPVTNSAGVGLLINTITTAFNMGAGLEWEE